MSSPANTLQSSDPWEMALIHRLIRRGFEQSQQFVRSPGAAERASDISAYVDFHLAGLHAHHSTEDDRLWPALRERANLDDALIQRMEAQHVALHDAVDTTRAELSAWVATPSAGTEALDTALGTVLDRLAEHLTEEERDIVPLIAVHITQQEWDDLGKAAFDKFSPAQRFTAMGEMLAAADPTEAAQMLSGLPAPVKIIWKLFGRRNYERSMARVRGSA